MLMIEPLPCRSMPGRKALIVRCMDLTLRSKAKSHSWSVASSTLPWCTKPAALKSTSTAPSRLASASIAAVSRASSAISSATPASSRPARPALLRSLAITRAPSRAKAMAVARPMPAAAAVQKATLPLRRSAMLAPCAGLPRALRDRTAFDCYAHGGPSGGRGSSRTGGSILSRGLRFRARRGRKRGGAGPRRQKMLGQVDTAGYPDGATVTRQPLVGFGLARRAQVEQKFKIGFDLAFRRQRTGDAAGLDQVKAVAHKAPIAGLPGAQPAGGIAAGSLDHLHVAQHRLIEGNVVDAGGDLARAGGKALHDHRV